MTAENQKLSSARAEWHPGTNVMSAWQGLLESIGATEQCPDEFTWRRQTRNEYCLECLDVAAHNLSPVDQLESQATCTVARYVPHTCASDHSPVEFELVKRQRARQRRGLNAPARIPMWLYNTEAFKRELNESVIAWCSSRSAGMQGLVEFAELVQLTAKHCLEHEVFIANTASHKFDVTAAALRAASHYHGGRCLSFRQASRYCKIVPALEEAIVWDMDLDGDVSFDPNVARAQLHALHQEVITERVAQHAGDEDMDNPDACYGNSLQSSSCRPHSLTEVKRHLPRTMHHIVKLWDADANDFAYDEQRIGELLVKDAESRQAEARGDVRRGEHLLQNASLDLRGIRTHVHDDEILNAILDGRVSASPGANGVTGHPYHAHASLLVPVFREAFGELIGGAVALTPFTEGLLRPIGKGPNPCTFKQIRDLELPNFDRKVIERLFCLLLDECASASWSRSQTACLKGRDIATHILQFNNAFDQAVTADELLCVLSLDCSKGFNRMSHSWIRRVLVAAGCPDCMVNAVMNMVSPMVAILVYNQKRVSRLTFDCGLRQGGPLSALLYVLCVDPLLCAFSSTSDVSLVLGFVDDWLATTKSPVVINMLQRLCDEFSLASGQVFNIDKSVILTSKAPNEQERAELQSHWRSCKIVSRHRIVGILYGSGVRPEDRYAEALRKFEGRIEQLRCVNMSLNMRLVTANVFLLSHFSFLNRFFVMPDAIANEVGNRIRQFITRICVGPMLVWTHCLPLLNSKVALVDIRLQNFSMLIHTANQFAGGFDLRHIALTRWQHSCLSGMAAAHSFFHESTGQSPHAILAKGTRGVYKAMLEAELPAARLYFSERIRVRNLSAIDFWQNVTRIQASATDHHKSSLLLWALNGLATSHRVSVFRSDVAEGPCHLCGSSNETLLHLTECPVVRECVHAVVQQHAQVNPDDAQSAIPWPPSGHLLQGSLNKTQILLILRINTVVWHARCLVSKGNMFADRDDLIRYMVRACTDPIWHKRVRKERRPVEPPALPVDAILYRSHGAARGQGNSGQVSSGAGAVCYSADMSIQSWMCVNLGSETNNVAEYVGALAVLERVHRMPHEHSVLQLDSMLVGQQLSGRWRVVAEDLKPYFRRASALLGAIRQQGRRIDIQHVYREYNKEADAKANLGADGMTHRCNW